MKKIILSIIVVFPLIAHSQNLPENINITLGGEYKNKYTIPGKYSEVFELSDGGYAFIVPATYKGYVCYRFDKNMDLISLSKILLEENDLGYRYNIKSLNNNIYLFLGAYGEAVETFQLFARKYNPVNGLLNNRSELLTIHSQKQMPELIENVIVSEDKSKVVVINRCASCEKKPIMKISCFDSQFNMLWTKNDVEWDENDIFLDNFQIDNNGNVYRLHIVNSNVESKLYFTVYKATNNEVYSTQIELENKVYFNISFNINETGGIVVMFYGNTRCSAQGIAIASYDKNKDVLYQPISTEFPSELMANEMVNGELGGLFSYSFCNLLPLENGNYALVAEQQYDETIDYNGEDFCKKEYSSGSTIKGYNRGSAMVVIFSPNGDVLNFFKIPKIQQAVSSAHIGIYSFVLKNEVYLFFNDNPANKGSTASLPAVFDGKEAYANIIVRISENGEISKYTFPENKTCMLYPRLFRILNNTELFYCGQVKSKFVAGKINFR